jgi:hypothetical protein
MEFPFEREREKKINDHSDFMNFASLREAKLDHDSEFLKNSFTQQELPSRQFLFIL